MGKKGSSTQTTENKPPAWAQPLFASSAAEAQKIYDSGAGGNVYQGQTVAGLGSTTQSGISGVRNAVSGLPGTTSSANNLSAMASGANLNGNPYFTENLNNQLDQTASLINSKMSGAGRYGSGANSAVLGRELGNIATSAFSDQYNRDVGNMLTANNMIDQSNSNLFQNRIAGNQAVINAGQIEDANNQAKLTADFTKWQSEDMQPWTRLGLLQSAAAGSAGNYGTNTQTQTQPFNAMQGIGALGSLLMKSDARLKTDIVPIGVRNGHTIYEWRYLSSPVRYRGVMAQDVIDIDPQAVAIQNDYYAVDYGRLGFEMEAA
ncbi:tail fiber domain-containing protein [Agrobacterium pusense]|uniref:tail fiber domain-containing protein n=1 Tax=Agrobacterium pusense TaxID=648995 RepID=UPI000D1B9C9D|nr:tail fiber domain-containing protein [Agrobacterium pusense]